MGVNMDKIRTRVKEQEQREAARAAGGVRWWRPKAGRNNIRLLPPWTDEGFHAGDFAREIHTHWNVGSGDGQSIFTCPAHTPGLGGPCAICDEIARLRSTGSALDLELADNMRAKPGYLSNIVNLDDPVYTAEDFEEASSGDREPSFNIGDTKIQVFQYGPMIYNQLLNEFDVQRQDLSDLNSGGNFVITKTGKGKNNTKYTVSLVKLGTPFTIEGDSKLIDLGVLNPPRSAADMQKALGEGTSVQGVQAAAIAAPPPSQLPPQATQAPATVSQTEISDLEQQMMDAIKGQ